MTKDIQLLELKEWSSRYWNFLLNTTCPIPWKSWLGENCIRFVIHLYDHFVSTLIFCAVIISIEFSFDKKGICYSVQSIACMLIIHCVDSKESFLFKKYFSTHKERSDAFCSSAEWFTKHFLNAQSSETFAGHSNKTPHIHVHCFTLSFHLALSLHLFFVN